MNFNALVESKMCRLFDEELYYFRGSDAYPCRRLWRLLEANEHGDVDSNFIQDILDELIDKAYNEFSHIELFILLENTMEFGEWISEVEDSLFDRLCEDDYENVLIEEALARFPQESYGIFTRVARHRCEEYFESLARHPINNKVLLQSDAYKSCDSRVRFLIQNILSSERSEDFLTAIADRHDVDYPYLAGLLMSSPGFEVLYARDGLFSEVDEDLEETAEDIGTELNNLRFRLISELNWVDTIETDGWLITE